MDCLTFSRWLENRDMHDVSEADKALKHAAQCGECQGKLHLDEQLDQQIYGAMEAVTMPDSLQNKIDLSLDRMVYDPSKKMQKWWYGIIPVAVAAMIILYIAFPLSSGIISMDELGKYVIADHGHHGDSVLVVAQPEDIDTLGSAHLEYNSVKKMLPQDFLFVGARVCPLGDCSAIHIVYLDKGKRVSLYILKDSDVNFTLFPGRKYTIAMGQQIVELWKQDGNIYAMTT